MSLAPSDEPVYRFLLLPSFSHPISVRITLHADHSGTVITRIGGGAGGYGPKPLLSETQRHLSPDEVAEFLGVLSTEQFWSQPTEPSKLDLGDDGTEWIMEAKAGHYHVVDRWEGGSLRKLGLYLLKDVGRVGPEGQLSQATE